MPPERWRGPAGPQRGTGEIMDDLQAAARTLLERCMAAGAGESALVVDDDPAVIAEMDKLAS